MNRKAIDRLEQKVRPNKRIETPIFLEIDSREPEYTQLTDSILINLGIDPERYELVPGATANRKVSLEDKQIFSSHDEDRVYWASGGSDSMKLGLTY